MISIVLRGGGRLSFLSGQGFTDVSHPELVSGSKETEVVETDKDRFRTKFGMTKTPRHPELGSGSFGFTLAEVLITLGIIGVVAAMTLPALIQKQNDAAIVTSLKKNYSILSQALIKAQLEEGFFDTWQYDVSEANKGSVPADMKRVFEIIKPELKVLKVCEDKAGCWHEGTTKDLNGNKISMRTSIGIGVSILIFKLADGTNICMDDFQILLSNFGIDYNKGGYVFWIDANGDKKPNTIGRDIFAFVLTNKGLVPAGIDSDNPCVNDSLGSWAGVTCTAKVMQEGKIDY